MIYRNKRDQEAWLREKTLESLKANTFLQENDIVQVAEDSNFYKVVKTTTSIPLQNELFAQAIPSELAGNIATATKLKTPRNIALAGDVTGNANFDGSANISITSTVGNDSHTHSNSTITSVDASKVNTGVLNVARIPNLDASKIASGVLSVARIPNLDASKVTSGTIDIARLPQGALERCVVVADDTARFKLTTSQVQQGDTVKVTATNKMYFVIDTAKLSTEAGYTVYTAGTATEVPWSGVTGKPSTMPNPQALTISLNGTSQGAYNGNSAKSINITAGNIGAYTKGEVDTRLNGKANSSHGNHVPATQTASNKIFLRNDNTWATITPANIGAQVAGSYAAASHTHAYLPLSGGTMTGNIVGQSANTISGFGKIYNAVWNDYAELFERGEETEVGDIIALDEKSDEERYIKATSESKVIVGVHSDTFAHLIGGENPPCGEDFYEYNIKKFIPVGLAGRVKVKVIGPIKKGDLITISPFDAGVGISINNHCDKYGYCVGRTIGQALENKDSEDIGLIKILIIK